MEQDNYSYVVDGKPENLVRIRDYFKGIAEANNIVDSDSYDILVAIGEATTNAIEHGRGGDVEVEFDLVDDVLTVCVRSNGAFIKNIPLPEEDNFRGRGILLMLALMDQVTIDEQQDGVTVVMSKHFKRAG
ncbi:MAG: ATP-binding protein [Candidatus Aquicultor sp.]|nr:ATP-binding protein [Candidatus Aquicultor sp.]